MKKLLALTLICLLCFALIGCDPMSGTYDYLLPDASIVGVELIDYDNPNAREINTFIPIILPRIRSFNVKKMSVIEALDLDKLADFSEDLLSISVWTTWIHLNAPTGLNLRIIYSDGSFDVLSFYDSFAGRYSAEGKATRHFGIVENPDDLIALVNEYFSTQLSEDAGLAQ